jgi:hypothetical protein
MDGLPGNPGIPGRAGDQVRFFFISSSNKL